MLVADSAWHVGLYVLIATDDGVSHIGRQDSANRNVKYAVLAAAEGLWLSLI